MGEAIRRMDVPQAFLKGLLQKVPGKGRTLVQFPRDITLHYQGTKVPITYEVHPME